MPYGTRAPKELLHHLPALILRRPSVSAYLACLLPGMLTGHHAPGGSQERAVELSTPTSTMTRTLLNTNTTACPHEGRTH